VAATCDVLSITSLVARKLLGAPFSLVRKYAGTPLLQWWRCGHGVVGSSKLRRAQKLTVLVRGFACRALGARLPLKQRRGSDVAARWLLHATR